MPLYTYHCGSCKQDKDVFLKLSEYDTPVECCDKAMTKVPTIGGIQGDEPAWLDDSVRGALQDTERLRKGLEKPITTRTEWKRHLKEHNIEPVT
jgi:putative FmdB family regulatory protein